VGKCTGSFPSAPEFYDVFNSSSSVSKLIHSYHFNTNYYSAKEPHFECLIVVSSQVPKSIGTSVRTISLYLELNTFPLHSFYTWLKRCLSWLFYFLASAITSVVFVPCINLYFSNYYFAPGLFRGHLAHSGPTPSFLAM
jgi:hypothetical protein